MTAETLILWLVVGLIAGWLASHMFGGGLGLVGDIVLGIVGAFFGGILFREFGVQEPFGGLAGAVTVAFLGAAVLLALVRLFRRSRWA